MFCIHFRFYFLKKSRTLTFCKRPPFAFMTEHICCGIVFTTLHNVTFISIVAYIFGRDVVLMTGESNHSFSLVQHIPKTFNGVNWSIKAVHFSVNSLHLVLESELVSDFRVKTKASTPCGSPGSALNPINLLHVLVLVLRSGRGETTDCQISPVNSLLVEINDAADKR